MDFTYQPVERYRAIMALLFSNTSAEVRGENRPERKFASTRDRTHNHKVMSPTRSPLSHLGRTFKLINRQQNFSLVQFETDSRQHFKVHLKLKNKSHIV
jgi:hypothetical protein